MTKEKILHEVAEYSAKVAECRATLQKLKNRQTELENRLDDLNKENERQAGKLNKTADNDKKFSATLALMRKADSERADTTAALERISAAIQPAQQTLQMADEQFKEAIQREAAAIGAELSPAACEGLKTMFEAFRTYEALREQLRVDCGVAIGDMMNLKPFFDATQSGRGKANFAIWRRIESCILRDSVLSGRA